MYDDYGFDLLGGLGWVGLFCWFVSWVGLGPLAAGLDWVGSQKMDQRPCLVHRRHELDECRKCISVYASKLTRDILVFIVTQEYTNN